ncbi:MAG: hypothetical protein M3416_01295, partial [Acidobacteriota bacterium]|nr:hypothetical protein [Acidobacteriota bacterium]
MFARNGFQILGGGKLNDQDISSAVFNSLAFAKGELGKAAWLTVAEALALSYTTLATLYEGAY